MLNAYLYRCPSIVETPTCCNCTTVHQGTYDQEFMIMCNEQIETPVTTTQTTTGAATTTSTASPPLVQTSTVSSYSTTHSPTTTQIYLTTPQSAFPSSTTNPSSTTKTNSGQNHISTTTVRPTGNPSDSNPSFTTPINTNIDSNTTDTGLRASKSEIIHQTVIHRNDDTASIIAIIISSIAIVSLIGLGIWSHKRHEENKRHKMVRPSGVELSPSNGTPLVSNDTQLSESMEENRKHVNAMKSRNSWGNIPNRKVQTARMPRKRGSELKRMTVDDWKRLNGQIKGPAIDRRSKPKMSKPRGPTLPSIAPNRKPPPVPTLDLSTVSRREDTLMVPSVKTENSLKKESVQSMANRFQQNHTGGPVYPHTQGR